MSQLPTERIVTISPGMSKMEAENKYLESFMDRDVQAVENAFELAMLKSDRASAKANLKKAQTKPEKNFYEKQITELTNKINKL